MSESETNNSEIKPGYKTTEFWLTVAACALGAFAASGAFPEESSIMKVTGLIVAALASMGYSVSRFMVKK